MKNLLRTLIFGDVSLTVADTTEMVQEGIKRHALASTSALVFGKALSAMTYMSSCLKGEKGEISLSVKTDGSGGEIAVSGNKNLYLRGYILNVDVDEGTTAKAEENCLGVNGSITIIRDDGYSRPFVGACALPEKGGVDEAFEEYFRVSEQLPTRIKTAVEFNEEGACVFAGVIALQPLPFTKQSVLEKTWALPLEEILSKLKEKGIKQCVEEGFEADKAVWEEREALYKCNCSREYLSGILVSLGEAQLRELIKEEGAARIHCHYCNTDYEFVEEDADKLFKKS